jgi:hypothetical protein
MPLEQLEMTPLSLILIYLNATLMRVEALCCEKSTLPACSHFPSRCNDFLKKRLQLMLIIINIAEAPLEAFFLLSNGVAPQFIACVLFSRSPVRGRLSAL